MKEQKYWDKPASDEVLFEVDAPWGWIKDSGVLVPATMNQWWASRGETWGAGPYEISQVFNAPISPVKE